MKTPLIGVTTSTTSEGDPTVTDTYVRSVLRSGGIPVLLPIGISGPFLAAGLDRLDGLLLTGGGDVSLRFFAGQPHIRLTEDSPGRDEQELELVKLAMRNNLPLLGICRGLQILNVAMGGTLYTDIADQFSRQIRHDCFPDWPRDYPAHPVSLKEGSQLRAILGADEMTVNSLHHQAIAHPAPGLEPVAFAPDGSIEAAEVPGHRFALGVQWHPEWMPAAAEMRELFAAFMEAASQTR